MKKKIMKCPVCGVKVDCQIIDGVAEAAMIYDHDNPAHPIHEHRFPVEPVKGRCQACGGPWTPDHLCKR